MKKHITYLMLLLLITSCSINKKVHSIGEFKFKLPNKALEIQPEDLNSKSKINQESIPTKRIYKIDDIYLGIEDPLKLVDGKNNLGSYKNSKDYYYKKAGLTEPLQYQSSLVKINDYETFIRYKYYKGMG